MIEKKLKPLALNDITIEDKFWKGYMELIREHVIPYQWEALNDRIDGAEKSYCMQNFRRAAGLEEGEFNGMVFQDSDLYKWLEAVAYSLMWHPDKELEKTADEAIDLICKAQQEDGYLDTYYIINGLDKRFTHLMGNHELYCLGHMIEAAVAYYKATGKNKLLKAAVKFVDCVEACFGTEEGKKLGYPGHEVAEMALVSLYELTGNKGHLKLANYFVDQRGQSPLYFREECRESGNQFHWEDSYFKEQYYQAGKPVRQQDKAEGHAVRAVYLYSGMADVASETDDKELFEACVRLWNNMVERQMYITGGIGSSVYGEAFTFDYDLPNDTIYAETCASIGLIFFARRMFEITKDSRYTDIMERALYNGVISGMSLDGEKFFYVNPLEVVPEASEKDHGKSHVKPERQKWFGCACCPPNIARLISSIGSYAIEQNENEIFLNLFMGGTIDTQIGGRKNQFKIETNYPWDGDVKTIVYNEEDTSFTYAIRIPDWCDSSVIKVNDEEPQYTVDKGYAYINRLWKNGDVVTVSMELPVKLIAANPKVREDIGKVAVMRGPVVYCLEEADNGEYLQEVYLRGDSVFDIKFESELLDGIVTLTTDGKRLVTDGWDENSLYRPFAGFEYREQKLKFIPYYAWTNRGVGEMTVWVKI